MRKLVLGLAVWFWCVKGITPEMQVPQTAVLLDSIEAIVFGQAGTEIVTKSDIARPSLTGAQRSRDDLLFERLVYLDAQKFKMLIPDEEAIDKYLATVQRENNLTQDQLKDIFTQSGYTYEEGREQFKRLYSVNSMLEFKIKSNVVVPRTYVEEYYAQHPVVEQERYELQTAEVAFEGDRKKQKQELQTLVAQGDKKAAKKNKAKTIAWNDPFWINKEDIAEEKGFIFSMNPGDVTVEEGQEAFDLFKLVAKQPERVVPLEERYSEIVNILSRPKFEELMEKYKQNLFDSVSILYFD